MEGGRGKGRREKETVTHVQHTHTQLFMCNTHTHGENAQGPLQTPTLVSDLRAPAPSLGCDPPGLSPTTWSTRAWLSSPTGCRETAGVTGKVAPGRPLASPAAQHGAHHIWVGLVGQPQCPQVEPLLELGLLGV